MKLPRRNFLQLAAGAAALPAVSRVAWAQKYPTRPIRLVVPFPPGGAFDFVGRPWAEKMKTLLGTIVVENIDTTAMPLGDHPNRSSATSIRETEFMEYPLRCSLDLQPECFDDRRPESNDSCTSIELTCVSIVISLGRSQRRICGN